MTKRALEKVFAMRSEIFRNRSIASLNATRF
jgi:hypothetical protein